MIQVALIGAGRIGRIHAHNFHNSKNARVRYVYDVAEKPGRELAAELDAEFRPLEAILADEKLDAAVIASSTNTHADLIAAAAAAGKAIFCEKPLDLDLDRARESVRIVRDSGVHFCIGFNRRHDPGFDRLKGSVDQGAIGQIEVVSITSRDPSPPPADYIAVSGGIFRDMMIHDFDMARWILGEDPDQVFASGSVLIDPSIGEAGDVDSAVVIMKTSSGRLCTITNSRRCPYGYDQRIEVLGSRGLLSAGHRRETEVTLANEAGFVSEPAQHFFLERYRDAYRLQIEKFLSLVTGETVELPGANDGLKALELADAAQRSLDSGDVIHLE